jgi:hypothetical protein
MRKSYNGHFPPAELNGPTVSLKGGFVMKKHVLVLTMSALILACGPIAASAQQSPGTPMMQQPDQQHTQHHPADQEGPGMTGQGGMMGRGMMGHGMMGQGGSFVMRIIFALMDSDGDGTISLQEFQAAHEKIFKAMDANKDGVLTLEEMHSFMHGTRRSVPQQ